ncbi:MAG: biotin/lipoyl-binding protein [Xanthomonadales bacterium]|nr:biotin/lipoyl-binding protein [Xanthomonadales bacterium]
MLRPSVCLSAFLLTGSAFAQAGQGIAALGRLEPEHGVIKVTAPSTPEALLVGLLVELHVEEGDDVRKGDLLAGLRSVSSQLADARVESE